VTESIAVPEIAADGRLAGKVAIVTGGGSDGPLAGSGAAISVLFAAKGASVVVADRDAQRARNTQQIVERGGGACEVICADITDRAACADVVRAASDRFGPVDVLVNNAAIAPAEKDPSDELWDAVFDLNLRAAKLMMDSVIPIMAESGGGAIVNIASTAGLRGGAGIAYSAAKSGLMGLTRAMAFAHGRSAIRLNSVAPGHMYTPMGMGLDRARRLRAAANLLDLEGTAWDVAYATLFLASDEARWITAVTLPVDGGTTQVMPLRIFPHIADAVHADGS
jgi:NAD(P)-dependent dehydrogenase (short-subunit alcohol dehydrogenase family)